MSFRAHLSYAGYGLAGIYAALGVLELVTGGDPGNAAVFGVAAAVTALLIALLLPLLAPREGGDSDEEDGGGGSGGGGGPPQPPWWPDFEREFWSHVDRPAPSRGRPPRERTPA